jgi:hypothetical protein|tara:strand:- start:190 stop:423 length:234 start_codon:yes stop_codon:yes gene_type:complete
MSILILDLYLKNILKDRIIYRSVAPKKLMICNSATDCPSDIEQLFNKKYLFSDVDLPIIFDFTSEEQLFIKLSLVVL